jgi:DNA repair protein RadA/Sms
MRTLYVCQSCGSEHRKWLGRCPDCGEWNSISEQQVESPGEISTRTKGNAVTATSITQLDTDTRIRQGTEIPELDRVLGGGLVCGSAVLIGGDPGIGKSTLLLQAASTLAEHGVVLYFTGEESARQVRLRGDRIHAMHPNVHIATSTNLEAILATIRKYKPQTVMIDSIQTMVTDRLSSAPGTVSQVRDCAAALIQNAKQHGHALLLVGHVTKQGAIAGPRVLEHMVDSVLYFEGEQGHQHRILRAVKNRFGPAGEIGVFEMRDQGLIGIENVSRLFLSERAETVSGSVVLSCMEGTRPLLVEIQALVASTVYASPRRSAVGLDQGRVTMLTAVLERRLATPLADQDVYVNVAGGARIMEPASDLAVLLAILSAFRDKPLQGKTAVFGEVGLTGEIRPVHQPEIRAREAGTLGFERLILPRANHQRVKEFYAHATMPRASMPQLIPVRHLMEAAQVGLA